MLALPSDYSIVGTVLAVSVAIILLSGLALYLAFRIRETLREDNGRGARTAKIAFLIGLLFLSGGVFYFFASGFNAQNPGSSTASTVSTSSSSPTSSLSGSTSTTTLSSSSSESSTSSSISSTSNQAVSMSPPSCAGTRVPSGSTFTCTLTIFDSGSDFSGATVVSGGDFAKFTFISCTEQVNGGSTGSVPTTSNTISVGTLAQGTTVLTLTVQAPTQQGQDSNSILTLNAVGFSQPVSVTFSIQVTA